ERIRLSVERDLNSYLIGIRSNISSEMKKKRGPKRKVSEDDLRRVHGKGLSEADAGKELKVDHATISIRWKELGLPPHRKRKDMKLNIPDADMRKAYDDGLTQKQTGERFGVSQEYISCRWKELKLKPKKHPRKGPPLKVTDEDLIKANEERLTMEQTAQRHNVSRSTVDQRWHKLGLKSRSRFIEIPKRELRKAYDDQLTQKEAGERFHVKPRIIGNRWRRMGLEADAHRNKRRIIISEESLRELHDAKMTEKEAATVLNISIPTLVSRWKELKLAPHWYELKN
ncbi:MAG: hypothetical protein ACHQX1_03635, partial [Candidatus Micrarchaeales archaeon]